MIGVIVNLQVHDKKKLVDFSLYWFLGAFEFIFGFHYFIFEVNVMLKIYQCCILFTCIAI
jgi:hypothetical protein